MGRGVDLTLELTALYYNQYLDNTSSSDSSSQGAGGSGTDAGQIRATAPMWRCSRIMHMQRDLHPTLLSSLEGIVDQRMLKVPPNVLTTCASRMLKVPPNVLTTCASVSLLCHSAEDAEEISS
uniref:Uncharacterized protein n=1 Tax=Branchiostoma floridae TaxID=7739 RepID=C3ZR44_BRAFL|eukprot:XP_002588906.1 hypothetical protein BRAFLDRAFT_89094 [Branchiostoma floridae]